MRHHFDVGVLGRLEADVLLPHPATEHEDEGHQHGDDHDEVLDVPLEASARLILLIVRKVAEHDGDEKVGRVDSRKEEEDGEHHRRRRALRDVLEADKAEDRGGQQREAAEDDDDPILVELAGAEREQEHGHRHAEADDRVGYAGDVECLRGRRRETELDREGLELHPELAKGTYDERRKEDPKRLVFEEQLHALGKGELLGVPTRGLRLRRLHLGGRGLRLRDLARYTALAAFGTGGSFLRLDELAVVVLKLVDALFDFQDEHHAKAADDHGNGADDAHRNVLLPHERAADGTHDDVHDRGRKADDKPDGRHDVRPLLGVGRDDVGHGLIHIVCERRNGDDGHAGTICIDDAVDLRRILRRPH